MAKSRRLEPIAKLAKRGEDGAARALGEYRRRHAEQEERLAELQRYYQEYLEQFGELGRNGADIGRINGYRGFLAQLADAVLRQQQRTEQSRQELAECERQWYTQRARRRALDSAVDRLQGEERRAESRREQRAADERAQRRSAGGAAPEEHGGD